MLKDLWQKKNRILAGTIGILMLVVVVFSAFFVALEAGHECPDEDCPICASIEQCENFLHQFVDGTSILVTVAISLFILFLLAVPAVFCVPAETPISEKVRLNI